MNIKRFCTTLGSFLLLFVLSFAFAKGTYAFDIKTGENIAWEKDQTALGSVYIFGSQVTVDGNIDGDLVCAGQDVIINGLVKGDVLCAGQMVVINGDVGGNVRVAGQTISIYGKVAKNVSTASQNLFLANSSVLGGDLAFVAASAQFEGNILKETYGNAESLDLKGTFGKSVVAQVNTIKIGEKANLMGDLTYTSPNTEQISKGTSQIKGTIYSKKTVEEPKKVKPTKHDFVGGWFFGRLWSALGVLVIIFVLNWYKPSILETLVKQASKSPAHSIGTGFVAFILWLPIVLVSMLTLIGFHFGMLLLVFGGIAMCLAKIIPALYLGEHLAKSLNPKATDSLKILLGIVVAWFVFGIPVLGWMISGIATLWGFGVIIEIISAHRK